ncbi:putative cyclic nucleotide-gated ion channel 10 [Prunus yedoensis var. nudiflora]|uniref:Putative cyclic nucleotide-gated ion channel 10 n=1 Tax=Prunus yedoensis var. nudiflora TaxID=2094558 RepID=A0A314UZM8_PRUYE|nr:putative cyclic nucleotide-gated ion channel 10 [Prunus yedoensis var. nudiflora]
MIFEFTFLNRIPNGGHKASPTWPTLEEILSIHHDEQEQPAIFFLKWDIVFAISCTVAVFLDPLYRYIPVVIEDRTCFHGEPRGVDIFRFTIGRRSLLCNGHCHLLASAE